MRFTERLAAALALLGAGVAAMSRSPEIMADAAHVVLTKPSREQTGWFLIDEQVLRKAGVTDLSPYLQEGAREEDLMKDLFV